MKENMNLLQIEVRLGDTMFGQQELYLMEIVGKALCVLGAGAIVLIVVDYIIKRYF